MKISVAAFVGPNNGEQPLCSQAGLMESPGSPGRPGVAVRDQGRCTCASQGAEDACALATPRLRGAVPRPGLRRGRSWTRLPSTQTCSAGSPPAQGAPPPPPGGTYRSTHPPVSPAYSVHTGGRSPAVPSAPGRRDHGWHLRPARGWEPLAAQGTPLPTSRSCPLR